MVSDTNSTLKNKTRNHLEKLKINKKGAMLVYRLLILVFHSVQKKKSQV